MRAGLAIAAMAAAVLLSSATVRAQPADLPIAPATTSDFPPGVRIGSAGGIPVYTDKAGHTLYGMDMRTLLLFGADTSKYCQGACLDLWQPLLAPAGSKPNIMFPTGNRRRQADKAKAAGAAPAPAAADEMIPNQKAPDWTIIDGPQGPQWVYKGWHMVFTRKDESPGSAAHEGEEDMVWNTLKYVPPVPKLTAPADVSTAYVDGAYVLVDKEGRMLFSGSCASDCAAWHPFSGALASRGVGDWKVSLEADTPQWLYRGKPVYVAEGSDAAEMPAGAAVLRP
jgi:predicted lipoprotein with Yx(FWY)xxD motif